MPMDICINIARQCNNRKGNGYTLENYLCIILTKQI